MDINNIADETPEIPWGRWYRDAREEAAFRYGLRRVPTDVYKTQWALGQTVDAGVRTIADHHEAYGSYPR